jgi:hypothetical protein
MSRFQTLSEAVQYYRGNGFKVRGGTRTSALAGGKFGMSSIP